jgi:hypothetical protein
MLLNGWKEIADYVQRGVRTVQRWEHLGLPVRRLTQSVRSPVIALAEEVDEWFARWPKNGPSDLLSEVAKARRRELHEQIAKLKHRSAELVQASADLKKHGEKTA